MGDRIRGRWIGKNVPSVDESLKTILENLEWMKEIPPGGISILMAQIAALQIALTARLLVLNTRPDASGGHLDDGELLTAEEAAELLKFKSDYVLSLARRGALPSIRHGRYVRFRRADLCAWIDQKGQSNAPDKIPSYNNSHETKRVATGPKLAQPYVTRIRGPRNRRNEKDDRTSTKADNCRLSASG